MLFLQVGFGFVKIKRFFVVCLDSLVAKRTLGKG
ncbi:MAG: hypothetical protein ACD_12C00038G0002 [uncultured bacterium]|nr:MAG: hypothetical protein ACD_12C00038G0002 [uncultured bacterium]